MAYRRIQKLIEEGKTEEARQTAKEKADANKWGKNTKRQAEKSKGKK